MPPLRLALSRRQGRHRVLHHRLRPRQYRRRRRPIPALAHVRRLRDATSHRHIPQTRVSPIPYTRKSGSGGVFRGTPQNESDAGIPRVIARSSVGARPWRRRSQGRGRHRPRTRAGCASRRGRVRQRPGPGLADAGRAMGLAVPGQSSTRGSGHTGPGRSRGLGRRHPGSWARCDQLRCWGAAGTHGRGGRARGWQFSRLGGRHRSRGPRLSPGGVRGFAGDHDSGRGERGRGSQLRRRGAWGAGDSRGPRDRVPSSASVAAFHGAGHPAGREQGKRPGGEGGDGDTARHGPDLKQEPWATRTAGPIPAAGMGTADLHKRHGPITRVGHGAARTRKRHMCVTI